MVEDIIVYDKNSGLSLITLCFSDTIKKDLLLIGGFFSIFKAFFELNSDLNCFKDVRRIESEQSIIKCESIFFDSIELIIIFNKTEEKIVDRILPELMSVIYKNISLFVDSTKHDLTIFTKVEEEIRSIVLRNRIKNK